MAVVNRVEQKVKINLQQIIKYQILMYCFFNDIHISKSELDLLAELSQNAGVELPIFCKNVTEKKIFKSEQSARNAISKAEKKNLLTKEGKNKKNIYIAEDMNIQSEGLVLLDIKILGGEEYVY
tara:strand:- start:6282 stop:6653 length:372 start_codon:yes stop_codon:yes gene_type:complete